MFGDLYISSIPYIVLLITIIGVYFVFTKPIYALYIIIFTFPLKNFYIFIGTSFEIWKLLSLAFLIFKFPVWVFKQQSSFANNKFFKILGLFILYVAIISIVNSIFLATDSNTSDISGGFFKNEGRLISQFILFLITLNLMIIPFFVVKTFNEMIKCLKILLGSIIILAIFGFLQFFIVRITGNNPFPIQGSDGISHTGYIMDSVFRINSLAGEPKHMAIAMVIGIVIIVFSRMNRIKISRLDIPLLFLFIFNLFFTYSTTGYVLLLLSLFIVALIYGIFNYKTIVFGGLTLLFIIIGLTQANELQFETFSKQFNKANIEIQDETIKAYFEDEPLHAITGTGLGNIHHYAVHYFPKSFTLFNDVAYKANSGIFYMVSDYGILGVLILLFITYQIIKRNSKIFKSNFMMIDSEIIILKNLTIVLSVLFLFRYYELFFLLLGLMIQLNVLLNYKMCQLNLTHNNELI